MINNNGMYCKEINSLKKINVSFRDEDCDMWYSYISIGSWPRAFLHGGISNMVSGGPAYTGGNSQEGLRGLCMDGKKGNEMERIQRGLEAFLEKEIEVIDVKKRAPAGGAEERTNRKSPEELSGQGHGNLSGEVGRRRTGNLAGELLELDLSGARSGKEEAKGKTDGAGGLESDGERADGISADFAAQPWADRDFDDEDFDGDFDNEDSGAEDFEAGDSEDKDFDAGDFEAGDSANEDFDDGDFEDENSDDGDSEDWDYGVRVWNMRPSQRNCAGGRGSGSSRGRDFSKAASEARRAERSPVKKRPAGKIAAGEGIEEKIKERTAINENIKAKNIKERNIKERTVEERTVKEGNIEARNVRKRNVKERDLEERNAKERSAKERSNRERIEEEKVVKNKNEGGKAIGNSRNKKKSGEKKSAGKHASGRMAAEEHVEENMTASRRNSAAKPPKKKRSRLVTKLRRLLVAAVLIIALLGFGLYQLVGFAYGKMNFREVESMTSLPMKEQGVVNILLIGNDSRENGEDGRSDAMILLSISSRTKKIYMTSFLRDIYVEIPGYDNNRLNAAYSFGGAELLMQTIEKNFDIPVHRYMLVNFEAFAGLVDAVGGVDLELTTEEIVFVNGYLSEYNMLTNRPEGTDNMDVNASGMVHLNGPQALAYSRNRYIGTDFGRTERQRKVLTEVIGKLPKAVVTNAGGLIDGLMSNLTTNLTQLECFRLSLMAGKLLTYEIISDSVPQPGTYNNATIRNMSVLEVDFAANIQYLKEKIYGE